MAGNIKGITIEIDGNTKKLNTALKGVNQNLKDTQYKLRDVEKGLKLNPGNTDLLKQKFKLLGDAVSEAKDKLKLLEDAEKQAAQQLKNGDIGQDDYDALKLKIEAAKEEVKRLQKAYDDFGSVASQKVAAAGKQIEDFGSKVATVGDNLTKNVTAPLAAVGGASVAAFSEVNTGVETIISKTGASGKALEEMQTSMENLASEIPTDFETAGSAIGEVNTRFGLTGEALETLSGQFLKFADLNGTDVSTAIDQTQKALSGFGLGAEDADELLDVLNKTGQNTGASMDSLLSGLIQNGTAFQEMGLSIDQATVFMGQMETSGANSETVMQGLRKALKNAAAEGKPMNEALSELQDSILNGTDGMDGLNKAYELFGKSGDQIYGAVKNGTIDFEDLAGATTEAGDSVSTTFEESLTPLDKFKTTMNNVKTAGADLGGVLLELAIPALEKLSKWAKELKKKWDELSPKTKDIAVKVALVAAAIGPLLSVGGRVIGGVGAIMKLAPKLAGVISFLCSPIGLVVVAIGALIAIGVALYKNWDTIKQKAELLGQKIKGTWDGIKTATSQTWTGIKTAISTKVDEVKTKISTGWGNLKTNVSNTFKGVKDAITKPFDEAKRLVEGAVDRIKRIFPIKMGKIFSGIKLPHFKITGGQIPWGIGGMGVKPTVRVEWYKKAYNSAVMFQDPTVLSTPYGNKGFGDGTGAEMVIGKDYLLGMISQAVSASSLARNMAAVGEILENYLPGIANKEMFVSGSDLVYANRTTINAGMGAESVLTKRGVR